MLSIDKRHERLQSAQNIVGLASYLFKTHFSSLRQDTETYIRANQHLSKCLQIKINLINHFDESEANEKTRN